MNLGICEWNAPVEPADRFEWIAGAGLQGMEIDLDHAGGNEARVRELADAWTLELPTLGINACCNHSMCDPAKAEIIHAAFNAAVKTALALGIPSSSPLQESRNAARSQRDRRSLRCGDQDGLSPGYPQAPGPKLRQQLHHYRRGL